MADELEQKQVKLEHKILDLSLERLAELAEHLKVNVEGDGRLRMAKKIRSKAEEIIDSAEDKEKAIDELCKLIETEDTVPGGESEQAKEEYERAKEELEKLKKQFNQTMELQKKQLEEASAKLTALETGGKQIGETVCKTNVTDLSLNADVRKALRRDFRIIGVIGGDAHKDRLSLVSLLRQIEIGLKTKYTESEVIEGVIRAISPSLKIRSYLEMMPDLTIAKLEQILKAHYKQKSSTEIYQELTSACQAPKESPQDFLIRAMDLRQQVLFTSQTNDGTVKYDSGLVNGLFRHVIETGLQSESIRAKLRPLLLNPDVSDEDLMEKLNAAASEESERVSKLSAGSRKSTVNQINAPVEQIHNKMQKHQGKEKTQSEDSCMATLKALQAELAALRSDFNKTRERERKPPEGKNARRRCNKCQQNNAEMCGHCYKCGSSEHFARGCRNQSAGNAQRLRPGDME